MPHARPVGSLAITAAGATDIGRLREHNEDAVLVRPDLGLFVVADGAGGHNAGNIASALAMTSLANYFEATLRHSRERPENDAFGLPNAARRLAAAIQKANRDIVEIARSSADRKGMGTTIVALVVSPAGNVYVGHVGDSRAYRLRGGQLDRLTQDHTLRNDVLEQRPDLSDEVLAKLPMNVVTRALGMEPTVRVSVRPWEALPGDRFLLCSDGLFGMIGSPTLREILARAGTPADAARELIAAANAAGGRDNIAALVIAWDPAAEPATAPATRPPPGHAAPSSMPPSHLAPPSVAPSRHSRTEHSVPEILIVGIESEPDVGTGTHLRVVPAASVTPGLIEALDPFLWPRSGEQPIRCPECGTTLDPDILFCTQCGAAQGNFDK